MNGPFLFKTAKWEKGVQGQRWAKDAPMDQQLRSKTRQNMGVTMSYAGRPSRRLRGMFPAPAGASKVSSLLLDTYAETLQQSLPSAPALGMYSMLNAGGAPVPMTRWAGAISRGILNRNAIAYAKAKQAGDVEGMLRAREANDPAYVMQATALILNAGNTLSQLEAVQGRLAASAAQGVELQRIATNVLQSAPTGSADQMYGRILLEQASGGIEAAARKMADLKTVAQASGVAALGLLAYSALAGIRRRAVLERLAAEAPPAPPPELPRLPPTISYPTYGGIRVSPARVGH